jgi:hypothetical protein
MMFHDEEGSACLLCAEDMGDQLLPGQLLLLLLIFAVVIPSSLLILIFVMF